MSRRRPVILGYCWKCGRDVETDFCDRCMIYVQPSPHQKRDPWVLMERGDAEPAARRPRARRKP